MSSRYFIHLTDESVVLRDRLGIEACNIRDVEAAVIASIREFRVEEAGRESELQGWRLVVTDRDGRIVVLLPVFTASA